MCTEKGQEINMKHIRKTTNGRKLSIDVDTGTDTTFVSLASRTPASERIKDLVASSYQGMRTGHSPTLCEAGVGGTYFMRDSFNRIIGVFKPHDEEMGCSNNPKGFSALTSSQGVMGGEAAFRECAAYVLDHEHFSGVPATDLVACSYPCFNKSLDITEEDVKIGSFQEYKEHDFDTEDISPIKAAQFPVNEVHKIAILDIRLFNKDRHGGNILVRKVYSPLPRKYSCEDCFDSPRRREYGSDADENGFFDQKMQFSMETESESDEDLPRSPSPLDMDVASDSEDMTSSSYELIPIDHGYTLPHTISGITDAWFEWLNWPQSKIPFSRESKEYIARLDAEHDIEILRQKFGDWINPEAYKVLRITTMWLKLGAKYNLSPYALGVRMCSTIGASDLEKICWEVEDFCEKNSGEGENLGTTCNLNGKFYVKLAEIMERKVKEISQTPPVVSRKLTF